MHEITFASGGDRCSAWHLPAERDSFAGPGGRPCVVMAPGFAGTRDNSLLGYAQGFAAAGVDVLLFDYRGFGASGGLPRQHVSARRQREDFHAAIAEARKLAGVDAERIVLLGFSYSGGHVIAVAARDPRVAATISVTPAMDGIPVLLQLARTTGLVHIARLSAAGLRDGIRALTGRAPHVVAVVGEPGSRAIFAREGGEHLFGAIAGPSWRNDVCARVALEVGFNRPIRFASRMACPLLVQVGTRDTIAPPAAARRAAANAGTRAELREYPVDHMDVYLGDAQRHIAADQLEFLRRVL